MKTRWAILLLLLVSCCARYYTVQDTPIISKQEVKTILKSSYGCTVLSLDNYYKLISVDHVLHVVSNDNTIKPKYVTDFYDCDDYAFQFATLFSEYCVGLAHVKQKDGQIHMLNVFIDAKGIPHLIDARTEKMVDTKTIEKFLLIII